MSVGDPAEFRARDVDRPGILPEAFMLAVEGSSGRVVGYASLILQPGSRSVAWHDMTAVRRSWRGLGVAGALKRATVGWAIANGLEALETGNDVDNAPDAGGQRPARLQATAGLRRDARPAIRRHHGDVTTPRIDRPTVLPPDPEAYDEVRNQHARARGLSAPYIAGGRDPNPEVGRREERFYGRLLLAMVAALILGGFIIGVVLNWVLAGAA